MRFTNLTMDSLHAADWELLSLYQGSWCWGLDSPRATLLASSSASHSLKCLGNLVSTWVQPWFCYVCTRWLPSECGIHLLGSDPVSLCCGQLLRWLPDCHPQLRWNVHAALLWLTWLPVRGWVPWPWTLCVLLCIGHMPSQQLPLYPVSVKDCWSA